MKRIISILHIAVLLFAVSTCLSCNAVPEDRDPVIFDDVERIELIAPDIDGSVTLGINSDRFEFNVSNDVKYIVLGIFDTSIGTQGKNITNEDDFLAGSRTGLDGFSRDSVPLDSIYGYLNNLNDFDNTLAIDTLSPPEDIYYYWAVWGYDVNGNLTHASEERRVDID